MFYVLTMNINNEIRNSEGEEESFEIHLLEIRSSLHQDFQLELGIFLDKLELGQRMTPLVCT